MNKVAWRANAYGRERLGRRPSAGQRRSTECSERAWSRGIGYEYVHVIT